MSAPSIAAAQPTPADPHDSERMLSEAEEEASGRERRIATESERVGGTAKELGLRLEGLRRDVAQSARAGDGEVAHLVTIVEQTLVPILDVSSYLKTAHAARVQALQARRKSIEQAERAVSAFSASLQILAQELEAHRQAFAGAMTRREEKARAKAEVEARRSEPPPAASSPQDGPPLPAKEAASATSARRGQARVRMQAAVDLSSDTNFYTGFSTNLSEGGLFIATVHAPKPGATVDLRFSLPSGEQIEVKGKVRWIREVNDKAPEIFPGVGVQFVDLNPQAAQAIKRFVSQREPMFFPD